jgi:hypothetical protein
MSFQAVVDRGEKGKFRIRSVANSLRASPRPDASWGHGARRANVSAPSHQNVSVASTRSANQDSMLGTHSTNFRTAPAMNEDSRENGSSGPVLGMIFTALALAILLMA